MKLIYTNVDGSVAVVVPETKENLEKTRGAMTNLEYENHVIDRSIPASAINVQKASSVPSDRHFRAAWVQNGESIDIDMAKARLIQEDKIRAARDDKWSEFDRRYVSAERDSGDLTSLKAERAVLRNIPNDAKSDIDAASTPDVLKAIWPVEL